MRYNTIIGGPARKNDPQTIEGSLVGGLALMPGSVVGPKLTGIGTYGIPGVAVPANLLLANHIAGKTVRDPVESFAHAVAVMCEDDVIYHALVSGPATIKKGDQLTHNGNGKLIPVSGDYVPLFWAFEDATITGDDLVAVRKFKG